MNVKEKNYKPSAVGSFRIRRGKLYVNILVKLLVRRR
jgi:hypothetical protein